MSMILYVSLYGLTGNFVSNCSNKISVFPEFPSPEFSLYLGMPHKNFFRTHTLENSHNLTNRIFGWYTHEYMDMILGYFHLLHFAISRCQYLFKQLFHSIAQFISQYPLAIFGRPYKMVSRVINCMALASDCHAMYYTKSRKKGNPFLPVLPHGVSRVNFS